MSPKPDPGEQPCLSIGMETGKKKDIAFRLYSFRMERGVVLVGRQEGTLITVDDVWPVVNVHGLPCDYFLMGREQWRRLKRRAAGLSVAIVAVIHSHPNLWDGSPSGPSEDDLADARRYWRMVPVWAVYHCETSMLSWYTNAGVIGEERIPVPPLKRRLARLLA